MKKKKKGIRKKIMNFITQRKNTSIYVLKNLKIKKLHSAKTKEFSKKI